MNYFKRATAATLTFFLMDSASRPNGKTSASVTFQVSKDGGAFAAIAGSVTEIASGFYKAELTAADLDGRMLAFLGTASGADPYRDVVLTDTILVSEVPGGLSFGGTVLRGEGVWTEAQRDEALRRLRELQAAVEAVSGRLAESVQETQSDLAIAGARISDARATIQEAARIFAAEAEARRVLVQEMLAGVPEALRQTVAVKMAEGIASIERKMVDQVTMMLRESDVSQASLKTASQNIEMCLRMLTASLSTEQLERMAQEPS